MKYFILFGLFLFITALVLHLENKKILIESHSDDIPQNKSKLFYQSARIFQSEKMFLESNSLNERQIAVGNFPEENNTEDNLPDNDELTDQAEEFQKNIEEIESDEEYERMVSKSMHEGGSDFISLNKKKTRVTE